VATELLYLRDAYLRGFDALVKEVRRGDDARVASVILDRTAFYPTGGGQPHDTGVLGGLDVVEVRKDGDDVRHVVRVPDVSGATALPETGSVVRGSIDWTRRHRLMRTHTALHILCGVIWHEYGVAVTGGGMEPLTARMDFEFDPLPDGFGKRVEQRINEEIDADRPVVVSFIPRDTALGDGDLIRTKVNLVPAGVPEIRIVDIVGLDKQADGGTHVHRTAEVGRVAVVKTESKGKAFKRVRLRVDDR
jgi:misacylated tRNA(Ala) deacylase